MASQNLEMEVVESHALVPTVELDNLSLGQRYPSSSPATAVSASEPNPFRLTPVHLAVIQNDISQLRVLLASGEYGVDARTPGGVTPLMLACLFDRLAACTKLLEKGASTLKKDSRNFSVKCYAKHIPTIEAIAPKYHTSQAKVVPNLKKRKRILSLIRNYSRIQLHKQRFNQGIIRRRNPESPIRPAQSNGQRLPAQVTVARQSQERSQLVIDQLEIINKAETSNDSNIQAATQNKAIQTTRVNELSIFSPVRVALESSPIDDEARTIFIRNGATWEAGEFRQSAVIEFDQKLGSKSAGVIRGRDDPVDKFRAAAVSGWSGQVAQPVLALDVLNNKTYFNAIRRVCKRFGFKLAYNPLDESYSAGPSTTVADQVGAYYGCHAEKQLGLWVLEESLACILGTRDVTEENVFELRQRVDELPSHLQRSVILLDHKPCPSCRNFLKLIYHKAGLKVGWQTVNWFTLGQRRTLRRLEGHISARRSSGDEDNEFRGEYDEIDGFDELNQLPPIVQNPVNRIRQFTRREKAASATLSKRASPVTIFPPPPLEVQERDTVKQGLPRRKKPTVRQVSSGGVRSSTSAIETRAPVNSRRRVRRILQIDNEDGSFPMEVTIYEPRPVAVASSSSCAPASSSSPASQANPNALKSRNATAAPSRSDPVKLPFPNVYELTREYQEDFVPVEDDTANHSATVEENTEDQVASSGVEVEKAPEPIVIDSDSDSDENFVMMDEDSEVMLLE